MSDLGEIVVTSHRSVGTMVRSICAVAGPLAAALRFQDEHVQRQMRELAEEVEALNRVSLVGAFLLCYVLILFVSLI